MSCSVSGIQESLWQVTDSIPISAEYEAPTLATFFTPPSHIRALRLHTPLVVGARGVGKTFWAQALQKKDVRSLLGQAAPDLRGIHVTIGHGATPCEEHPSPSTFASLLSGHDAVSIWRAVLLKACVSAAGLEQGADMPHSGAEWKTLVPWVADNPERVDRIFLDADRAFARQGMSLLIVFDALDRVAYSWKDIDELTTGLLRTALQFSTFSHIKTKIFLREDHCSRISFSFPDASKLLASKVELSWTRAELYGMLWKRLCNGEGDSGKCLRGLFSEQLPNSLEEQGGVWFFRNTGELTDKVLKPLFHRLTGPYMGRDRRRGMPYTWTVGHLADARQQTSPRSFMAAIARACQDSHDKKYAGADHPIHYESIKSGVQIASQIRVAEMQEDNPWATELLEKLKGMNVPCPFQSVQDRWQEAYAEGPSALVRMHPSHTPPEFESAGWAEVRRQLEGLGFCLTLSDGRFNMPDLYRVGFGLGRKGGVKPLT